MINFISANNFKFFLTYFLDLSSLSIQNCGNIKNEYVGNLSSHSSMECESVMAPGMSPIDRVPPTPQASAGPSQNMPPITQTVQHLPFTSISPTIGN